MRYLAACLITALLWTTAARADSGELRDRRLALKDTLGDHAILVMFPEEFRTRSNDVSWPYRQSNHLHYLTHATEPGTHLVIVRDGRDWSEYLFAKLSDPYYEVWEGRLPTEEELQERTGIETIYPESEFHSAMEALLNGNRVSPDREGRYLKPEHWELFAPLVEGEVEVWLDLGRQRGLGTSNAPTRAQHFAAQLREVFPEIRIRNIGPQLEFNRHSKSDSEIDLLQDAIDITREAQLAAMARVQTASHEYEVQAAIEFTFRDLGACCPGFPSIVASGDSTTILHYSANNAPLAEDALLLADIGAEVDYYSADITRTFPVSGKFSEEQRLIYELVLKAQRATIAAAKPGSTMQELEQLTIQQLGEGLLELGLITEINYEQVKSYFMHGLGHSLGMDVHDAFEYHFKLEPGVVTTIEPGIYVRPQDVVLKDWYLALDEEQRSRVNAALERFGGIGVRIEDVILITRRGNRLMSADIPVTVEEIETTMAAARR